MKRSLGLAVLSFCWVATGCGAPDDSPTPPATDSGPSRSDGMAARKPNPPILDQVPATVCGPSVPIRGTATPGVSVYALGGLETSGVTKDANPSTGRFCMDVRLKTGTSNVIEVRVHDPVLGESDPATVTVTQSACKDDGSPTPPPAPQPQDVALGIKGRASKAPDQGNEGFLTDGNPATAVTYSFYYVPFTSNFVWVTLKLAKPTAVSKIVVKWLNGTSNYADDYKVLVSTVGDPGDPNLTNGYWDVVKSYDGTGAGGTETVDLSTGKPVIQHVALWLTGQAGMGHVASNFTIAELEVWDSPAPTSPTPTTPTNTCASLGD